MEKQQLNNQDLKAIRHIRNWLIQHGTSPSVRQLMTALGYKSPRSAQDILAKLRKYKIVKKTKSGGFQLINDPKSSISHAQTVNVPIVGVVSCGQPILAEENIEGFIPVSTSMAKPGSKYFILRASGNSMDLAGIKNGDLALVRQQSTAQNGDNIVALIDDSATIKEYSYTKNAVVLKPKSSDPTFKPIILTENFQVQGVVMNVIPNV